MGDAVLAGGEAAALVVIEACVRLVPGVLGQADSLKEESFEGHLLEHPQYTRPRVRAAGPPLRQRRDAVREMGRYRDVRGRS